MSSEKMVEHVARAIAKVEGNANWMLHIKTARAAILAMREPTTDMLEAATTGLPDWGSLPDEWRKMIDHAASETFAPLT